MNDLAATFDHQKRNQPVRLAAAAVAILGLATILGAWFFQIVIGLPPCPLCLEQRYAYYFSIPLAVLVLLGVSYGASRKVLIAALAVIARSRWAEKEAAARRRLNGRPHQTAQVKMEL